MHLAIFGGSFDPVHIAHKKIVIEALENLEIDRLEIVPTYLNPFKKSFKLSPKKRYERLRKTFNSYEKGNVCDFERN